MSARDDILSAIRAQRRAGVPRPAPYASAQLADDAVTAFAAHATRAAAEVRRLAHLRDVPAAVAEILRDRNRPAIVHLPANSALRSLLAWDLAPQLALEANAPGPDDTAIALAPFAIAETGTLVHAARSDAPASWHFRPGLEIAVVRADDIMNSFEDVLAKIRAAPAWPSTLNLVTGPSRTGDIEQTIELGAHGPKELVVLAVDA